MADFPRVDFAAIADGDDPFWSEAREPWERIAARANDFLDLIWVRERASWLHHHCLLYQCWTASQSCSHCLCVCARVVVIAVVATHAHCSGDTQ